MKSHGSGGNREDATADLSAEAEGLLGSGTQDAEGLAEAFRLLAEDLDAEIGRGGEGPRLARLLYERGRLEEERVGSPDRALSFYKRAIEKNRDFLPAVRAARRLLLDAGNVKAALALFDAELRVTPNSARKADLHVAKARVEELRLGDRKAALASLTKALELDRQNRLAQKVAERLLQDEESWAALDDLYGRMADGVANDDALRAVIEVQRARLREGPIGDEEAAAERCQAALDRDPDCVPALEALKRLHRRARRWKDLVVAMEHEAGCVTDPRVRALDHRRVGRVQADRLGATDRAITSLERAAAADPSDLAVLGELSSLYEQAGRWEELANTFRRELTATTDKSERLDRLHRLAVLLEEELGRPEEAMDLHKEALSIDPTFLPGLQGLGRMYRARHMWTELVEMTLAELEKTADAPRRAAGHCEVGRVLEIEIGQLEPAVAQYEKSLAFDPGYVPAFKALTRLYADLGRFRELAERYERAADTAKQPIWAISYLEKAGAIWEERLGELDRAAAAYSRILALDEESLIATHALQRVFERAGRWLDLVRSLEREAERAWQSAEVASILHRVAEVLEGPMGDADGAAEAYRRVLQVDPRHRPSLTALGRLLHARGRWDDLIDLYRKEMDVSSGGEDKLPLLYKTGEIFEQRLGRVDEAIRVHREALDLDPAYRPALRALARIHRERGDWERLVEVLEAEARTLTDSRLQAAAYFRVAEIYEENLGRDELAGDAYRACLKAVPNDTAVLEALGRLHSARGEWLALADVYERIEAATEDTGTIVRALLGRAEILAGPLSEAGRAVDCYEKVLELAPDSLLALMSLEVLYRLLGRTEELASTHERFAVRAKDVPAKVAALHQLAHLYETRRHPDADPTPLYRRILQLAPGDEAALDALEHRALADRDPGALVYVLGQRLSTTTDPALEASIRLRLAETLEVSGDLSGAASSYARCLELEPDALTATRGLARVSGALGDAASMEEAARREAAALRDSKAAARSLLRAAESALERGDAEGGIRDLERAMELDPDSDDVALRLESTLRARHEERRLVDLFTRAAAAAKNAARKTEFHALVGELQRDVLRDRPAAAAAFGRALRSGPNHVPSLVALGELLLVEDQWNEAVVMFERVVTASLDTDVVTRAHLRLALLFDEKLGEPRKALESLRHVLGKNPRDTEALGRAAECYRQVGEFGLAVETLLRLVDVEKEPAPKTAALIKLAEVHLEAGDMRGAVETLRRAMAVDASAGVPGRALARLVRLHGERGDWKSLADAYTTQIAAIGETNPASAELHVALAELMQLRLGNTQEAIRHLRIAVDLRPDALQWRLALAAMLRKASLFEDASKQYEALIAQHPFEVEAFRELRRLDERLGRRDRMHLCEAALMYLRAADPVEAHSYRTWRSNRLVAAWRPMPVETVRAHLAHPLARIPALELVEATSPHLGKIIPPDLEGLGVTPKDRIGPRDGHPLFVRAREIADALGVGEFQLHLHPQKDRGAVVEGTSPPSLVVPHGLQERSDREQTFVLARALASLLLGTFVLQRLTAREVDVHVVTIVRSYVTGFGEGVTGEDYLEERARRVHKALPRSLRKALAPLAERHVQQLRDWNPVRFVDALGWSLDRAGLLLADDLATALDSLKRSDPAMIGFPIVTPQQAVACLSRSEAATEMLKFHLSEDHRVLRAALGIADDLDVPSVGPG